MSRIFHFDSVLLLTVLLLLGVGIIMIYSSSAIFAEEKFDNAHRFLIRQIIWIMLGLAIMILLLNLDYQKLETMIYSALLFSLITLVLVLLPWFGTEVNGARRWLSFGFINFQPSEFAKLILTVYCAYVLAKKKDRIQYFSYSILPLMFLLSWYMVLIVLEPDLGAVLILTFIVLSMLYIAGARLSHLGLIVMAALPVAYILIWQVSYRRERMLAFLSPESDPLDSGFQIIQSKIAIGSGGFLGHGLGEGLQKLFYLPESHTDFIFSVLCEELGFLGGTVIIFLFGMFIWRGFAIALKAGNHFGRLLAAGLTLMIGFQAFINIAMAMGMFPTKGLALPFISFGGSSLLTNLAATGILLNISTRSNAYGSS
ncbi:putative lipid II flippase FtsW [bacterium]|nr:putative lipid II flippase FtsW [bacterium]